MMDLPQLLVTGSVQKVRLGVIHRTGLSVFLAACLTPAILETSSSTSGVWPGKTRGATGCHREKRAGGSRTRTFEPSSCSGKCPHSHTAPGRVQPPQGPRALTVLPTSGPNSQISVILKLRSPETQKKIFRLPWEAHRSSHGRAAYCLLRA